MPDVSNFLLRWTFRTESLNDVKMVNDKPENLQPFVVRTSVLRTSPTVLRLLDYQFTTTSIGNPHGNPVTKHKCAPH